MKDQDTLDRAMNDPQAIIRIRLRPLEEVIPTGMSAECILMALQNNRFKPLDMYAHM